MAYVGLTPVRKNVHRTDGYVRNPEKTAKDRRNSAGTEPKTGKDGKEDPLGRVSGYVRNAKKTEKELYVTAINCSKEHTVEDFLRVKKQFGKEGGILAHHGWQSFHGQEDVTPEQVHQIGVELANLFFGERFQVIVTTHLDREHLHNHFFVNSVSFIDGKNIMGIRRA